MQRYDIGSAEESVERCLANTLWELIRSLACVRKHVHAERLRYLRHLHANVSKSYNAESLACKLKERLIPVAEVWTTAPHPIASLFGIVFYMVRDIEQVSEHHLCPLHELNEVFQDC
jgi:hypothetical protein